MITPFAGDRANNQNRSLLALSKRLVNVSGIIRVYLIPYHAQSESFFLLLTKVSGMV